MTLYVTFVLFLSSKYRFPGVYFYLFLVLVSTYLVVVYTFNYRSLCSICKRIYSFSFYEFYNNLVYSLEYVFLVFDILRPAADETKLSVAREKKPLLPNVVVLSQLHCILYYFVACKHLDYFVFFC